MTSHFSDEVARLDGLCRAGLGWLGWIGLAKNGWLKFLWRVWLNEKYELFKLECRFGRKLICMCYYMTTLYSILTFLFVFNPIYQSNLIQEKIDLYVWSHDKPWFQIWSFYIHFLCCDQPGNHLIWSSTGSDILTWSRVGCWGVKSSLSLSVTLTATITTTNTVHYNISLIVIQWINQMFLEQSILVCTYRNVAKFQSVTMSP